MKKKQSKKALFFVLIIVVLFGFGIFVVNSFKKPAPPQQQNVPVVLDDTAELTRLSAEIADGWKIPDLKYEIKIQKRVGDHARVMVIPTNQTLDPLQIIFVKKDDKWTYVDMGTTFPDLETQIPDLFRD